MTSERSLIPEPQNEIANRTGAEIRTAATGAARIKDPDPQTPISAAMESADALYHDAGWALVRQLLLLRDAKDPTFKYLYSTTVFEDILAKKGPEGNEIDRRYCRLAHLVNGYCRCNSLSDSALPALADDVLHHFESASYEGIIRGFQRLHGASRLAVQAYHHERERETPISWGPLSLLRGILAVPQCRAARYLRQCGIDMKALATAIAELRDLSCDLNCNDILAAARQLAHDTKATLIDSTDILTALLLPECSATRQLLLKIKIDNDDLNRWAADHPREGEEPDWHPKPSEIPRRLLRALNQSRRPYHRLYYYLVGQELAATLRTTPNLTPKLQRLAESDLCKTHVGILYADYPYAALAREVLKADYDLSPQLESLAREVIAAYDWLVKSAQTGTEVSKTLKEAVIPNSAHSLEILEHLLAVPEGGAVNLLRRAGYSAAKILLLLADTEKPEEKYQYAEYLEHASFMVTAKQIANKPSRVCTLDVLRALLEDEDSLASLLLGKLGFSVDKFLARNGTETEEP